MAGLRISGSETFIPDNSLKPRSWSTSGGDELTLALQQHAIDILFGFNTAFDGAVPASNTWLVFSPRAAGLITNFDAYMEDTGTTTDVDFVLKKNGTTVMASDLTIVHGSTDRTWYPGTLTPAAAVTFVADDLIEISLVNTSATAAHGAAARIRGYYVGD